MAQRTINAAAIEAEVDQIRSLGIDVLRARWRMLFGAVPPKGLTKDIIGRMIAYRIQEEAFGGIDRDTLKSWTGWLAVRNPTNRIAVLRPEPFSSGNTTRSGTPSPSCPMGFCGET